jgi:ferredoxin
MRDSLIYLRDVVTLTLDQEKCMGCGTCLFVCPHAVLSLTDGKVEIANRDACMECGACARNCPAEALDVRSGVGCAAAVINAMLGRKKSSCCCVINSNEKPNDRTECSQDSSASHCC